MGDKIIYREKLDGTVSKTNANLDSPLVSYKGLSPWVTTQTDYTHLMPTRASFTSELDRIMRDIFEQTQPPADPRAEFLMGRDAADAFAGAFHQQMLKSLKRHESPVAKVEQPKPVVFKEEFVHPFEEI